MKPISVTIFLLAFLPQLKAQTYTGLNAKNLIPNTSTVKVNPTTKRVQFITFEAPNKSVKTSAAEIRTLENILGTPKGFEFKLLDAHTDNIGEVHHRYQQYYQDIPVENMIFKKHENGGFIRAASGLYHNVEPENTAVYISFSEALNTAIEAVPAWTYAIDTENVVLTDIGSFVYLDIQNKLILAYKLDIHAYEPLSRFWVYIDAQTGELIQKKSRIHHTDVAGRALTRYNGERDIITDSYDGYFRLRESGRGGGIFTYDLNSSIMYSNAVDFTDVDNYWDETENMDNAAFDAHINTAGTYDYFLHEHGRNSFDGNGSPLISYIHYGFLYTNAFWNGEFMTYGDGNGMNIFPLTSTDIVAHEITHGVTEFSAGLEYSYESGALNESFSDIFGICVDFYINPEDANWQLAEQIYATNNPMRDFADPNSQKQPDTYLGDYWHTEPTDHGGVHVNSGVQNFWFYLLANGGSGINDNGEAFVVKGIGLEKSAQIAYRSLTVYLSANSQYNDARFYSIQAARDLFGDCSVEVAEVTNAWHAVGVGAKNTERISASFNVASHYCEIPAALQFENTSQNGISYLWEFGDGNTSSDENPLHTYASAGTYTIKLTAYAPGLCNTSDEHTKTNYLTVVDGVSPPPASVVPVTNNPGDFGIYSFKLSDLQNSTLKGSEEGYLDLACSFHTTLTEGKVYPISITTNTENNEDIKVWIDLNNDGDFTESEMIFESIERTLHEGEILIPPGVVFNTPLRVRVQSDSTGFTIPMNSSSPEYGQVEDYSVTLIPSTERPIAEFKSNRYINPGETIQFKDISQNVPTSWKWILPGATVEERLDQHPLTIYSTMGTYDVTLIVENGFGSDTLVMKDYLTVSNIYNLGDSIFTDKLHGFLFDPGGPDGTYPDDTSASFLIQNCADTIELIITDLDMESCCDYVLIFDGENANSDLLGWFNGSNPPATYKATSGSMFIRMISDELVNGRGFQAQWKSIVNPVPTPVIRKFEVNDTAVAFNQSVSFSDLSSPKPYSVLWEFGDGNVSHQINSYHRYNKSGEFEVLHITTGCKRIDTTNLMITVQQMPEMLISPDTINLILTSGDSLNKEVIIKNNGTEGELWYSLELNKATPLEDTSTFSDLSGARIGLFRYNESFRAELEDRNAQTYVLKNITSEVLDSIDILYLGNYLYSLENQIDTIIDWLEQGGSLLVASDYSKSIPELNRIINRYGLNEEAGRAEDREITRFESHVITKDISVISNTRASGILTNNNPQAKELMFDEEGLIQAIALAQNSFKLLVINNDLSAIYGNGENEVRFLNQAFDWLANKAPHWIKADNEHGILEAGDIAILKMKINATDLSNGDYYSEINFFSNDSLNTSEKVKIRLTVISSPKLKIGSESIDFGHVEVNDSSTVYLYVNNSGIREIKLLEIESSENQFVVPEWENIIMVPPQAGNILNTATSGLSELDIPIVFKPLKEGRIEGKLTIKNDEVGYEKRVVDLMGYGLKKVPLSSLSDASQEGSQLVIYPNPSTENSNISLKIEIPESYFEIRIINALGTSVYQESVNFSMPDSEEIRLNIQGLPRGIYKVILVVNGQYNLSESLVIY